MPQKPPIAIQSMEIRIAADFAVALPEGDPPRKALLVALHGWGEVAERFIRPLLPLTEAGFVVVAPQAPHPFYIRQSPKRVGFTWLTQYERDRAISETNDYLSRLIAQLQEAHEIPAERVFLLGFSQGVSMAYRFALSGTLQPAGMIACAADLPPDVDEKLDGATPFPVLITHSPEDTMVSPAHSDAAAARLTAAGFPVSRHDHEGGHRITPALVEHIGRWLACF